ncbi:MAG TPA: peptide deformylase, partial [Spirochaetes bacterium]|nr:peptide deformylase [Spirochaetota bacterium]
EERINLVNPVISSHTREIQGGEEGCLSIPEVYAEIDRFKSIHVEAQSLTGEKLSFNASDLLARVIQHEIDHLDGILFVDHLDKLDKLRLKGDLKKVKKKYRKVYA